MWIIAFLIGSSIGSFLNVCIDRLPKGEDIVKSRSHCDYCKKTLHWYELIPLCSWIFQMGTSKCCNKSLSFQYPLIELLTGIVFALIISIFPHSPLLIFASICISIAVIVLTVSDMKYQLLPTPFFYVWLLGIVFLYIHMHVSTYIGIYKYVIPSLLSGLFFFILWYFSKGKAMGDGDMYLASLIGLTVGFPGIIIALYVAFLTGAMVGVILILGRKKTFKSHIAFGPFLITGLLVELLVGQTIYSWWQTIL